MFGCPATLCIQLQRLGWQFRSIHMKTHTHKSTPICKIHIYSTYMYICKYIVWIAYFLYIYNMKFHNVIKLGNARLSERSEVKHTQLNNFFQNLQQTLLASTLGVQHEVYQLWFFRIIKNIWNFFTSHTKRVLSKTMKVNMRKIISRIQWQAPTQG